MAYCTHCGIQAPEDARFCQKCGQLLIRETESGQISSSSSTVSSLKREPNKPFLDDIREYKFTESIFISFLATVMFYLIGQLLDLFTPGRLAAMGSMVLFGGTWGVFIRTSELIMTKTWGGLFPKGTPGALVGGLSGFLIFTLMMFVDNLGRPSEKVLSGIMLGLIWFSAWGTAFAVAREIKINFSSNETKSISFPDSFIATLKGALKGSFTLGAFFAIMAIFGIVPKIINVYWVLTLTGFAITLGIGWFTDKRISGK